MAKEHWKDIHGYEGLYKVSNTGQVKSLNRVVKHNVHGAIFVIEGRIKKQTENGKGYMRVFLSKQGEVKTKYVHRLVAEHFLENPNVRFNEVNHINGDKRDNSIENLEWCTHEQNLIHGFKTGLIKHGEESNFSRLNEEQVLEIIRLKNEGMSAKKLGEKFNVYPSSIHRIMSGASWKRLTGIIKKEAQS